MSTSILLIPKSASRLSMPALSLRIPPVAVLLIAGLVQHLVSTSERTDYHWVYLCLSLILTLAGVMVGVVAVIQFRRHNTTVDPRDPTKASALITQGVFRYSRNPIYLAMGLLLAAQGIWLEDWLAMLIVPLFCAYINWFQIKPEEHALMRFFGRRYRHYCQRTRRWL